MVYGISPAFIAVPKVLLLSCSGDLAALLYSDGVGFLLQHLQWLVLVVKEHSQLVWVELRRFHSGLVANGVVGCLGPRGELLFATEGVWLAEVVVFLVARDSASHIWALRR